MKTQSKIILVALLAFLQFSCSNSDEPAARQANCLTDTSEFKEIYEALLEDFEEEITLDYPTHFYDFKVLSRKNICGVGYQSLPSVANTPYLIEIEDKTNNRLLYSGEPIFSSTATSYVSVGSVSLNPGTLYTIKRTIINHENDLQKMLGRSVHINIFDYNVPITHGDFEIITPRNINFSIPYIDIVFEQ